MPKATTKSAKPVPAEVVPINKPKTADKPKKAVKEVIRHIDEIGDPDMREAIHSLALQVREKSAMLSALEKELKGDESEGVMGLRETLLEMLKQFPGLKGVEIDVVEDGKVLRVAKQSGSNSRIDKGLLLSNGVSAGVIKKSTKTSTYTTVTTKLVNVGEVAEDPEEDE